MISNKAKALLLVIADECDPVVHENETGYYSTYQRNGVGVVFYSPTQKHDGIKIRGREKYLIRVATAMFGKPNRPRSELDIDNDCWGWNIPR